MEVARYASKGLSPPTRGNPRELALVTELKRSIPAHAGEPPNYGEAGRPAGVYPRPRGGTDGSMALSKSLSGLSPPTRGNLWYACRAHMGIRSIPAHAGEPRLEVA